MVQRCAYSWKCIMAKRTLVRTAEKTREMGVRVVVECQRRRASGARGRLSQSYAMAKAGSRKPRKQISSNTGATRIPKNVVIHADEDVRKNSSIGSVLGGVMKYVTSCIAPPKIGRAHV